MEIERAVTRGMYSIHRYKRAAEVEFRRLTTECRMTPAAAETHMIEYLKESTNRFYHKCIREGLAHPDFRRK